MGSARDCTVKGRDVASLNGFSQPAMIKRKKKRQTDLSPTNPQGKTKNRTELEMWIEVHAGFLLQLVPLEKRSGC